VVSTLQAIYRQNAGQLIRAFFVQLPLALLLGVVAIQIVILCLSATDAMCTAVAGGSGSDVTTLLAGITGGLVSAVGDPTMATFVLLMVGLLVAVAAFVLWLELLVRAAAVYVAVLFLPLALATLVWPSISHWCRRLVETLAALILSKFVIVATEPGRQRGVVGDGGERRSCVRLRLGPGGRGVAGARHVRPVRHSAPDPPGRSRGRLPLGRGSTAWCGGHHPGAPHGGFLCHVGGDGGRGRCEVVRPGRSGGDGRCRTEGGGWGGGGSCGRPGGRLIQRGLVAQCRWGDDRSSGLR
jgi:hypothetical protein